MQYLLLMGQYLQGTQKSVEAWAVHGLAVKAAFQLGLHSSEASQAFSPLDREIRKRVWFACVILDRYGDDLLKNAMYLAAANLNLISQDSQYDLWSPSSNT